MQNNFNLNLYKKSEQSSNATKSPHEIVRFLMENLLKSMKNIQDCDKNIDKNTSELSTLAEMNKKEIASFKSKNASKALTIIYSLQISLDFDKTPEIAKNLFQLYEFCRVQIINSLLNKTKSGLIKAIEALKEILDGWLNIDPRKTHSV
jgi:flagellar protein FliS